MSQNTSRRRPRRPLAEIDGSDSRVNEVSTTPLTPSDFQTTDQENLVAQPSNPANEGRVLGLVDQHASDDMIYYFTHEQPLYQNSYQLLDPRFYQQPDLLWYQQFLQSQHGILDFEYGQTVTQQYLDEPRTTNAGEPAPSASGLASTGSAPGGESPRTTSRQNTSDASGGSTYDRVTNEDMKRYFLQQEQDKAAAAAVTAAEDAATQSTGQAAKVSKRKSRRKGKQKAASPTPADPGGSSAAGPSAQGRPTGETDESQRKKKDVASDKPIACPDWIFPLESWGPPGHEDLFNYNAKGQLTAKFFSTKQILKYLQAHWEQRASDRRLPNHPWEPQRCFKIWVQRSPAKSRLNQVDSALFRCKWEGCPLRRTVHKGKRNEDVLGGTINVGYLRVAFDEFSGLTDVRNSTPAPDRDSNERAADDPTTDPLQSLAKNPFEVAMHLHLFCLEQICDPVVLHEHDMIAADMREFPAPDVNRSSLAPMGKADGKIKSDAFDQWFEDQKLGRNDGRVLEPRQQEARGTGKRSGFKPGWRGEPREYEDSLSHRLVSYHIDNQTRARQRTRNERYGTDPTGHNTLEINRGDLRAYVETVAQREEKNEEKKKNKGKSKEPAREAEAQPPGADSYTTASTRRGESSQGRKRRKTTPPSRTQAAAVEALIEQRSEQPTAGPSRLQAAEEDHGGMMDPSLADMFFDPQEGWTYYDFPFQ
ncbi:hypothetical protein AAL_04163 [Moelleriella libera RCEF 2490]|uniref:Uncharacterized protein n=1 Tax=Moelleriella libera RCEF 2490 TaxID=1081109 RepID=A0A168BXA5_9HYPO|nr:hypothetical protein AAL_04163 [Moelleriella libera RCEF 2490]